MMTPDQGHHIHVKRLTRITSAEQEISISKREEKRQSVIESNKDYESNLRESNIESNIRE